MAGSFGLSCARHLFPPTPAILSDAVAMWPGCGTDVARTSFHVWCRHQERPRKINIRNIPGTRHPGDEQGSTGRCPRDLVLLTLEKLTEKGTFAGTPAGCSRKTRPSRGFPKFYVIWSYVPFLLAKTAWQNLRERKCQQCLEVFADSRVKSPWFP